MNMCSKCHKDTIMRQKHAKLANSSIEDLVNGVSSSIVKEPVMTDATDVHTRAVESKDASKHTSSDLYSEPPPPPDKTPPHLALTQNTISLTHLPHEEHCRRRYEEPPPLLDKTPPPSGVASPTLRDVERPLLPHKGPPAHVGFQSIGPIFETEDPESISNWLFSAPILQSSLYTC
ncbi:unnamed protein product [Fraxinus pennsylvanica]|uniref:Uncharacterized protein n=1 Tax=Fraxinus pennsylvanica TaxID=56036 RepID=A0AAD2E6V7_9LAMI|nr:unnamed protein product [Fraxinus pennsylvanica]